MKRTFAIVSTILFLGFLMVSPSSAGNCNIGKWDMYEIELTTTTTYSNPFTDVNLSATFTAPKGRQLKVDGFYDGDGLGGQEGNVWKIRFMPDEIGNWTHRTASTDPQLNGKNGSFKCIDSDNRGLLIRDQNYPFSMKFVDGAHFFQNGCDDPEDFLAVQYGPQQERFEAIDYLTSVGVNELYMGLVNGCPGDGGKDSRVEPWLGDGCPPDFYRLDLSDLHKWDETFKYMSDKGMVAHLVLLLEDSRGLTTPLKNDWDKMEFYLKEMIARFGAYPNIIWNIAEEYEEFLSDDQGRAIAQYLTDNDPYQHLITVHQLKIDAYFNFAGDDRFDLTALQYCSVDPSELNNAILTVRDQVESSGRKIPVSITEWTQINPAQVDPARKGIWAIAMGGGTYEIHLQVKELNNLDDLKKWDTIWKQANILRQFMENISYYEMAPNNTIITSGDAFALEKRGERYVVYLYNGGSVTVNLSSASGTLEAEWYNLRNGTYYDEGTVTGGGSETFTPPFSGDAVLHLVSRIFDTGGGTYPSISGTHTGTIKPTDDITVQKMYTYLCAGTSGHSEYVRIWNASGTLAEGNWSGYEGDWHTISFDKLFIMKANKTYNYTICTGAYPQIIHAHTANVTGGTIRCEEFVDANGKSYNDGIPTIKLYSAGAASTSSSITDIMVDTGVGGDTEPLATVFYNTNNSAVEGLFNALKRCLKSMQKIQKPF